ncbi:MAG: metallophosphoesterase family protein [Planctomycetes bacterium]|nr:metallophosphoesterase family protein [Planctomycetota bacterium]
MKIALISDIHGNLEALEAVFAHIDEQGDVEEVICLGDVVGYGPNPEECADLLSLRCKTTLLGNHDHALLNAPLGFNRIAAGSIEYTRRIMEPGLLPDGRKQERWDWLKSLPERHMLGKDLLVHASPRDNIFEYILSDDAHYAKEKIFSIMAMIARNVYVGHTHRPGIITEEPRFYTPEEIGMSYEFEPDEKLIINVSSVGQPRDRDPRSCYATVTDDGVTFHRVAYDVEAVIAKFEANENLDSRSGERLREGR